jgi:two-component system alkaline phosphatase synthesis response regulator PhoP
MSPDSRLSPASDHRTILVIEDDRDIARLIERELLQYHYRVERAETGRDGLDRVRRPDIDLIVLDVVLPDLDGLDLCRRLRSKETLRTVPILVLTALGDETHRIDGLDAGADDYMTKPFSLRELSTRIRALLRRAAMTRRPAKDIRGDLEIDRERHEVTVRGRSITLTPMEFSLLEFLARHPDRVFTRDELLTHLWGEECLILEHNLDVHICSLRRKIEADPKRPAVLVTIRNVGFKLVGGGPVRQTTPTCVDAEVMQA